MRLFIILAASPDPDGPQWIIRAPIRDKVADAEVNALSVPPQRNDKVPAFAPVTPSKT